MELKLDVPFSLISIDLYMLWFLDGYEENATVPVC
jgi:hypothetical protein